MTTVRYIYIYISFNEYRQIAECKRYVALAINILLEALSL